MHERDDENLFERIEREALFRDPEDAEEPEVDIIREVAGLPAEGSAQAADLTLGGYIEMHQRPPAFEGLDGQPYTVDVESEATNDALQPFAAFFVFVRWAATGAGIMEHVESEDVAHGQSEAEARAGALELTLYEVKLELDAAIERKRRLLEE
ncbi:MAG: hypothetical protein ACRENP_12625 [Longimicrobiales bacterium]